jgi:hypothetical protein
VPAVPVEPVVPVPVVEPVLPVVEPVVEPVVPPAAAPPAVPPAVPEALVSVPLPLVPPAPIEVPLPVVLPLVPIEPEPLAVLLLVVSLGVVVVEGDELDEVELAPAPASFLPQAVSDRAAIRASAAHCAIGDLIIRNSLGLI